MMEIRRLDGMLRHPRSDTGQVLNPRLALTSKNAAQTQDSSSRALSRHQKESLNSHSIKMHGIPSASLLTISLTLPRALNTAAMSSLSRSLHLGVPLRSRFRLASGIWETRRDVDAVSEQDGNDMTVLLDEDAVRRVASNSLP